MHRRVYNARIIASELAVFGWWESVIRSFSRGYASHVSTFSTGLYIPMPPLPPPPRLCALRFIGDVRETQPVHQLSSSVPTVWSYLFRSTCLIFGLGILALVAFLEETAAAMEGSYIWFYMDSNNSLSAMTRGDSNTDVIATLVSRAWELIQRHHIRARFSRVPSELNPADLPTRGR